MKNNNLFTYLYTKYKIKTPEDFEIFLSNDRDFYTFVAVQNTLDKAHITLHQTFGFGPEKQKRFHDAYEKVTTDVQNMIDEDKASCSNPKKNLDIDYTRDVIDRALKEACGEYFKPWEERYK